MKKLLSFVLAIAIMVCVVPFGAFTLTASAATSGNYTYTVSGGEATITDVSESISGAITIPSTLGGYPVKCIGVSAFENCDYLTSVKIPTRVISIGSCAFLHCENLKSVTFPNSVTSIGASAFGGCTALNTVTIPNSVKFIDNYAFASCTGLIKVSIGSSVKSIGMHAFDSCIRLEKVIIPNSVKSIGYGAFQNCTALTSAVIGSGVKSIDGCIFSKCISLEKVTIGSSVKSIAYKAFSDCYSLETVYYCDSKSAENNILVEYGNEPLDDATWYYNSCIGSKSHKYTATTTKATLSKNGSVTKKCTVCGNKAKSTIKYAKSFKLTTTSYTYNGKVKTPGVIVKDSAGKTLKKNTDYTVSYASGRKNVGTYKVTIKMKGKYLGTKTLTFKINPVKTSVSKLTAGKKSITVNISKKSTQVSGYQVQYSTSKKFTSAKTKTISSYKTTKYTLKSLSAKKTYYVRVRTYKTVSGKKYYSGWSTYKYVKTK